MTIDRRHHFVIVLDTETCNTHIAPDGKLDMRDVLVYDLGWQVIDTTGRVYERRSFVIGDIFLGLADVMKSAYYADKIPAYWDGIKAGDRILTSYGKARSVLVDDMRKYGVTEICAHNARFDVNALNNTERYITKSKYRYFFPYGTKIWDTMLMAGATICKQKGYRTYCEKYGYITKNHQLRKTAEILYRYISGEKEFAECHTGLEDVEIESKILVHCIRQHKKMRKVLFE